MKKSDTGSQNKSKQKMIELSKAISYVLRHGAKECKIDIDEKGYVKLDDLLNLQILKSHKATKDSVFKVVKENDKKRFEVILRDGVEYIRAVQGHSISNVKNEEALDLITNIFNYPTIIHGTYYEAWKLIEKSGLNKMNRNAIRMAF